MEDLISIFFLLGIAILTLKWLSKQDCPLGQVAKQVLDEFRGLPKFIFDVIIEDLQRRNKKP
ncbi:MAG: hypothetical protein PHS07_01475 [Patescibacteria group bacterium]|nr:hypothetical protein [Patescibacteria group bacterium]